MIQYTSFVPANALEPGEQSVGILLFQNCPHHHLVGVTFDPLGRGLQPYVGAVSGTSDAVKPETRSRCSLR